MSKSNKNKSLWSIGVVVIVVIVIAGVANIGRAQLAKSEVAELTELAQSLNNADAFMVGVNYLTGLGGSDILGSSGRGSRFPNGISADTTSPSTGEVRGTTLTITGTSTVQSVAMGSNFSETLTFTAAATTTPGGLFSIQNTGTDRVCTDFELYVYTGAGSEACQMTYEVSTSTSASAWSNLSGSIIASTTPATSTTFLLNDTNHTGTNTNDAWLWKNGEYLMGAYDQKSGGVNASSSCYTAMAGRMYANCFSSQR